jgi:hypothetical protein
VKKDVLRVLQAHILGAHNGIQLCDLGTTDTHVIEALEDLLEAVKIISSELQDTDAYLARIAQP